MALRPTTIETFGSKLQKLVANFDNDVEHYLSKGYLEAQVRTDFITPLFEALGWDVSNIAGLRHDKREVIVERGESDTTGRPDYSFRVDGQTKFFVEAKAPAERANVSKHVIQAKSYAWNTRDVLFVVLTDFRTFRFYDASIQPDERKPEEGILRKWSQQEYLVNIEKLWEFSKERVCAGSLDAMLSRDARTQRLRIPVDQAFLVEMTGWREDLAKDIHRNHPTLTARQLNEAVQRLLDRIIFIRIAEDRRIIEKRQLADAVDEWKARGGKFKLFEWLDQLFHKINEDFNGEIFKPRESDNFKPSSEALAKIIERLYPPKSPYRFDVIGVELLGFIYERYLGNTIRVTANRVKVEEKPEVRKAGGVYYTPSYIVDYVVKETVGKAIAGKTPSQIERLHILDPACGSGSFLIGAFQNLVDYHMHWYLEHEKPKNKHGFRQLDFMGEVQTDADGQNRLSVYRKVKILRNNLMGVDIDPQAVEITMMSLYLKALEGEKSQLPPKQHLLPELKYNIICGNSLIGPDIYEQAALFDDEAIDQINAFNWASGFPEIMASGGFDVVVGNPPWVFTREGGFADAVKKYIDRVYVKDLDGSQTGHAKQSGKINLFAIFILKSLDLLKKRGKLGYVVPNTLLRATVYDVIRKHMLDSTKVTVIADLGSGVFEGVTASPVILVLEKTPPDSKHEVRVAMGFKEVWSEGAIGVLQKSFLSNTSYAFTLYSRAWSNAVIKKMLTSSVGLGIVCNIYCGIATGPGKETFIKSKKLSNTHKPLIEGKDISRYLVSFKDRFILYDRSQLHRPREESIFLAPEKLITQRIAGGKSALVVAYDDQQFYTFNSTNAILPKENSLYSLKYIMAILNSTLLNWFYIMSYTNRSELTVNISKTYLERLPIRSIMFGSKKDKDRYESMIKLVDELLAGKKKKRSGTLAQSQIDRLDRELAAAESRIDTLVYDLYDITDKERSMIETDGAEDSTQD